MNKLIKTCFALFITLGLASGCDNPFLPIIPTPGGNGDSEVSICSTVVQQIKSSTSIDRDIKMQFKKAYKEFSKAQNATVQITACYKLNDSELEAIASGFIFDKISNEDSSKFTYYVCSSASGVFYRYLNSTPISGNFDLDKNTEVIRNGQFEIVFGSGQRVLAQLQGYNDALDVVVFKFESAEEYDVVEIGDSKMVEVGEQVYTIGTPYIGYEIMNTVATGVVSGLSRMNSVYFTESKNNTVYQGEICALPSIQFDASLNPGMEGGPLVNSNGEVIGMNSYKYGVTQNNGTYESISFATPINSVINVAKTIVNTGTFERPTLGIMVSDAKNYFYTDGDEWLLDNGIYKGIFISEVVAGGKAYNAGMLDQEVLTKAIYNGDEYDLSYTSDLTNLLFSIDRSKPVELHTINKTNTEHIYTINF